MWYFATSAMKRIVIVGAGFGGLRAAKGLAKANAHVTIIDKSNHHLFQPLLYQVATAGLSPAQIAVPIRHLLRRQKNTEVLLDEVFAIDPARKIVRSQTKEYAYDFLILATGSLYNYFGKDQWQMAAPSLKTLPDALNIRRRILSAFERAEIETDRKKREALLTFVVIGGGPTGVELAGAIAELCYRTLASDFRNLDAASARILLIEAGRRILQSFPETLSVAAEKALTRLGVRVMKEKLVEEVTEKMLRVGSECIESFNIFWAAGIKATPIAKWLDVECDRLGRVSVEGDLSIAKHPEIFVIGDAACVKSSMYPEQFLPAIAPVAMQQGEFVADVIQSRLMGKPRSEIFQYRDKGNLATVGRAFAVADFGRVRTSGLFAWCIWVLVHILYLIGFRNRLLVLIEWAWAYFTWQRGARIFY
jgi:NADH dehydrogenase